MHKREEIQKKKDELDILYSRTERLNKVVDRSAYRCWKLFHKSEDIVNEAKSYFRFFSHIWYDKRMKEIEEEFRKEDEDKTNDK